MATSAAAAVVIPFDLGALSRQQRLDYLQKLWNADVDPVVFLGMTRRLGFAICPTWDDENGMPMFRESFVTVH